MTANKELREQILEAERHRSSRARNKKKRTSERTESGQAALEVFRHEGYQAYLKTPWWRRLKRKRLVGQCRACRAVEATQLHHTVYRIGCEDRKETIPLCRDCHMLLHDKLSELFPELTRGKSARYTREIWPHVFENGLDNKPEWKPRQRTAKQLRWAKRPLKRCPKDERAETRDKQQDTQLRAELIEVNKRVSPVPLAPNCASVRPTRKPCGALASKLQRLSQRWS